MHIITRFFIIGLVINCVTWADSLDTQITVKTRQEVLLKLKSLRDDLTPQASLDLAAAIRAIERRCDDPAVGLSKEEGDSLCIALIAGRTPRQIILTAAGILLAESSQLESLNPTGDVGKLGGVEFARRRYLTSCRSTGLGFVKTYAMSVGDELDATGTDRRVTPSTPKN